MGKIEGSWSGMRKFLEEETIAASLRGRVRYNCTTYVGMDGCRVFEIFVDNEVIKRFSWETVNSDFIEMGYVKKTRPMNIGDYWDGYWDALKKYPMEARTEYTDEEFCAALEGYRNQSIQKSVYSKNPIVKMFALLDKRVGRRTLEKIEEEIHSQPEWVRFFYEVRCNR